MRRRAFSTGFAWLLLVAGCETRPKVLAASVRQRCVEVLRKGMHSDEFWPAIHAAEALTISGHGSEVRRYLEPKLESERDDQRRCGLARELARAGDLSRSAILMQILASENPHGHVHAAESLYKVGWVGDDAPLRRAFAETEDIRLKLMSAAALAKHGDREAMAELRRVARNHPDPEIFRLAIWVLARMGKPSVDVPIARSRLGDAETELQRSFLENALAALGDGEGKVAVLRNLHSSDAVVRTYAAVFAGESGLVEAVPKLVRQLEDSNLDARIRAAQALLVLEKNKRLVFRNL